jgi:hypothetical protein
MRWLSGDDAVEDKDRRLTLDCDVETDRGKSLPAVVLELKAIDKEEPPPGRLARLPIWPIKLSRFLWATVTRPSWPL